MLSITKSRLRNDLQRKLEDLSVRACCGRYYVQTAKLVNWLRETPSDASRSRLEQLLLATMSDRDRFLLSTEQVSKGTERCVVVFCILVELNEGHLLLDLIKHELFDANLPFDLAKLQSRLRGVNSELAHNFNLRQWKYCPFRFELDIQRSLTHECILPICVKQRLSEEGGIAHIYKVMVQEEFVHKSIRKALPRARHVDTVYGAVSLSSTVSTIAQTGTIPQ